MRRRLSILALAAAPLLGLAAVAPAAASPAGSGPTRFLPAYPRSHAHSIRTVPDHSPSAMAGFAFVNFDGTLFGPGFTYDSAGGVVSAISNGTGLYQVTFGGISFPGGDVQVSSVGGGTCTVEGWSGTGSAEEVFIDCFNFAGAAANQAFSVLVTQPHTAPNGFLAYDWVYNSTGSGKLTGPYQYNSSHHRNSTRHLSTGHYLVTVPGVGLRGAGKGTVKVSTYGISGVGCQLARATATRSGEKIFVDCFNASGGPVDSRFDVVYARGNNLMGQNGKTDANAFANGTATLYQPKMQFDSRRHARITVVHVDRGLYELIFVGSSPTHHPGGFGNVQVTPAGSALRHCFSAVEGSTHVPIAFASCTNAAGVPVNTPFMVQYVIN